MQTVQSLLWGAVHYLYMAGEWEINVTAIAPGTATVNVAFCAHIYNLSTFVRQCAISLEARCNKIKIVDGIVGRKGLYYKPCLYPENNKILLLAPT